MLLLLMLNKKIYEEHIDTFTKNDQYQSIIKLIYSVHSLLD